MLSPEASSIAFEHQYSVPSKPLHIQAILQSLNVHPYVNHVETLLNQPISDDESSATDVDDDYHDLINGVSKAELKADKASLYNFGRVKKNRRWIKNILLSESSSDEDDDNSTSEEKLQEMLRLHKFEKKCQLKFHDDPESRQKYKYYSVGLLSNHDHYADWERSLLGPKKKLPKEHKLEKKVKAKLKKLKKEGLLPIKKLEQQDSEDDKSSLVKYVKKKLTPEQAGIKRKKIWLTICKKEIPKAHKQKASSRKEILSLLRKCSREAMKERRKQAIQSQKATKDVISRAKRLTREMMTYWKTFEKTEKAHRKRVLKEEQEQQKMNIELQEIRRQQRKLNFLITQTELYAHFMARKIPGATNQSENNILDRLNEDKYQPLPGDDYDAEQVKSSIVQNAQDALDVHVSKTQTFDKEIHKGKTKDSTPSIESSLANPTLAEGEDHPQPNLFNGILKCYQLKGMNWLGSLFNQGINGILADEMGLGKTVQSIAFLAHLAERHNIWGPFLVVAPASTLHNWQQEVAKFLPKFKIVPYWGNTQDRRILRQFWNQPKILSQDSSFHIVITSYQLVIQDVKYFQKIRWYYMILDEAQALKSSSSVRWKILLGFSCRNRLLLTGTPIQNSMAELWALLHFIMPTLFDSHDEFNEWFSKDIESHAEKQTGVDETQLSRLHMILKPFMLRRVKKDVENELSDKIEVLVYCPLTTRQRILYQGIKNKICIEDLLQSTTSGSSTAAQSSTNSLMNLVMQFRKVCNHPELFERRSVKSPSYLTRNQYIIPKLVYREAIVTKLEESKQRILYGMLYIHSPQYIQESLFHSESNGAKETEVDSCFSFLRFIDVSPAEMSSTMLSGLLVSWISVFVWLETARRLHHEYTWQSDVTVSRNRCLDNKSFLLEPSSTIYFPNVQSSENLHGLVFTGYTQSIHTFTSHTFHYIPESAYHRKIRIRHIEIKSPTRRSSLTGSSPPSSPTKRVPPGGYVVTSPRTSHRKTPHSPKKLQSTESLFPSMVHVHKERPSKVLECQPTYMPGFLLHNIPKLIVQNCGRFTSDRSAQNEYALDELCGTPDALKSLVYGTPGIAEEVDWSRWRFHSTLPSGLAALAPPGGWSNILIPDKEVLISDAGKLFVLDSLLSRLKAEGHRVLIYSQMTKMIDILEEYMWHRKHTFKRLDGSSKISDRRDMVDDFQKEADIFVFLLSTRAGGLGINLTAADTVIFYDSDWNPTVDQQAMDRAHRLGQTKQVTVYRLICKGTIEERILQRAKEKSEIQRMVISGGNFRPDALKAKEVVSLLLDDEDTEKQLKQNLERDLKDSSYKEKDRKRKRGQYAEKKKKSKITSEEQNRTIPAMDAESLDSQSVQASPQSVASFNLEACQDDSSNDGLVIVDDANMSFPSPGITSTPPIGRGRRGRGRPRGSGVGRRQATGRGRGTKVLTSAQIAGAKAAQEALGYLPGSPAVPNKYNSSNSETNSNRSSPKSMT